MASLSHVQLDGTSAIMREEVKKGGRSKGSEKKKKHSSAKHKSGRDDGDWRQGGGEVGYRTPEVKRGKKRKKKQRKSKKPPVCAVGRVFFLLLPLPVLSYIQSSSAIN